MAKTLILHLFGVVLGCFLGGWWRLSALHGVSGFFFSPSSLPSAFLVNCLWCSELLENYIFTLQYLNSHYRFPSRLKFSLRLPKLLYCKRKPSLENSTLLRSDHCHLSMQGLAQIGIHLDCASAVRSYTPFFGVVNLTLAL